MFTGWPPGLFFGVKKIAKYGLVKNGMYLRVIVKMVQLDLVYCVDLVTPNLTQFSRLTQFLKVELKRFGIFKQNVTFVGSIFPSKRLN